MVNFLGVLQNEWAGAQAFSSFDTYLAPFVKADKLSYSEVKQCIQAFVFGVNTPSRWGSQAPFTNITLDWVVPTDMAEQPGVVGGQVLDFTYADCQKEMDVINRAFLEVLIEGDYEGRGFAYPIPTYNITADFDWEHPNTELLFKITGKYGTPYFQNFVNSQLKPGDVRSMCCRLQLDKRELRNRGGGLFGSDEFTGSIGVVTINMPRIGYLSSSREEFFLQLDHLMDLAKESLETKRAVVTRLMDEGLFPYTKRYLRHWNNHFSTIGLIGMNEAVQNFLGKNLITAEARDFCRDVLTHMRERLIGYQQSTGHLYNLEATPGEGTSHRLARIDHEKFSRMTIPGGDSPYYTNSSQLPVDATDDIFAALDLQQELQKLYTGGTVFHTFTGESIDDPKVCAQLVKKIAQNYRIPYFTISPTFSVCKRHGYLKGEQFSCPTCSEETEVYSRIVGYYRPVKNWNDGKRAEYTDRKEFTVEDECRGTPAVAIDSFSELPFEIKTQSLSTAEKL
jgi:ribonucleoside-triphosphate reductase